MSEHVNVTETEARLAAPFAPGIVRFKPGATAGGRALAMPYVTARDVMDRLDQVVGPAGWKVRYDFLAEGNVMCFLSLRLGAEWIEKSDVGGPSEQPDEGDRVKAAVSDSLKRAAVVWGVGRYLYRLPAQWCDYDSTKRRFVREPSLPDTTRPAIPPRPTAAAPPIKPAAAGMPRDGEELTVRLGALETRLIEQGLCRPGDLTRHVLTQGEGQGFPSFLGAWQGPAIEAAVAWATGFWEVCLRRAIEDARQAGNRPWVDVTRALGVPGTVKLPDLSRKQLEEALAWLRREPAAVATQP